MKKLLYGVLGVLAIVGIAQAAQNLRQNPDGTADWVSTTGQGNPVGAAYINLTIGLSATAGVTHYVVVPITDAKIADAKLARQTGLGAGLGTTIRFFAGQTTTPMRFQAVDATQGTVTHTHTSDAVIHVGSAGNITTYQISSARVLTRRTLLNNSILADNWIAVFVTSTNTTNTTGHLIITVVPK